MTAFVAFLREKVERYIELRRSVGYAFNKQGGTLPAFVRYVERSQLDAPTIRTMALDFVLSFGGATNSRAVRRGVLRRFHKYLAVYAPRPRTWSAEPSSDPERFPRRAFCKDRLFLFARRLRQPFRRYARERDAVLPRPKHEAFFLNS